MFVSPLRDAMFLEPEAWWLVAAAALGLAAVLRRAFARAAGAGLGLVTVLACIAALLWPRVVEEVEEGQRTGVWQPRERSGRLLEESWLELQGRILEARRGGGLVLTLAGDGRPWVPAGWEVSAAGRLRRAPGSRSAEASSAASAPALAALEHDARAVAGRAALVQLLLEKPWEEPGVKLTLEARPARIAGGAYRSVASAELSPGARSVRIDVPRLPDREGPCLLRARLTSGGERLQPVVSSIELAPPPRVALCGAGCDEIAAGLSKMGYRIQRLGAQPPEWKLFDLVLVGAGWDGDERLVDFVASGGGLWIGSPRAWEEAQQSPLATLLPARILPLENPHPDKPSAEGPAAAPESEPAGDDPGERKPVEVGDMALVVLLDCSGSFVGQLPTAWRLVATALKESEGFTHVGVIGFNRYAFDVIPMRPVDEGLSAEIRRAGQNLGEQVERGKENTLLERALVMAGEKLAGGDYAVRLVVVVSDGLFEDEPDSKWKSQAWRLSQELGVSIAAIRVVGSGYIASPRRGEENMNFLAREGGTKRAKRRDDLAAALRILPSVAREVAQAARLSPGRPGAGAKKGSAQSEGPGEPEHKPEPEVEPAAPALIPIASGLHPAEGFGGELAGAPWGALKTLRRCRLEPGAAVAWNVGPAPRRPLFATIVRGRGKVAVQAARFDPQTWPEGLADERFALFVTRVADYLRRPPQPLPERRLRVVEGALLTGAGVRADFAGDELGRALGGAFRGAWGTWVRSPERGVFSTLRAAGSAAGLEGERRLEQLWESLPPSSSRSARAIRTRVQRLDPQRIGMLLGAAIGLELALLVLLGRLRSRAFRAR